MANSYEIHKALFIGVGGSGGTTLRFLHQELLNALQERGWNGELPACWQFLLMDVAGIPDGVTGRVPNVLTDKASFFGLTDRQTDWDSFLRMIPEQQPEVVAGWKPEPPLPGEPYKGAGQLRALGRLVAMTRIAEIKQRINQSLLKLGSADPQLQEVAALVGCKAALGNEDMHVYLVTSLGGGSGSGMFLDISTVLEADGIAHVNVLYAPDVFDQLAKQGGNKDVVANTFGAMSELLSAFEGAGSYSEADLAMLQRAGIAISLDGERTTDANIILGRRGDGFEFEEQKDVYHAAARILSAIALEGSLEQEIQNYILQNPAHLKSSKKLENLKRPQNTRQTRNELATSMGMASVTTGRAAFGQYAAERLTSYIVDRIRDDGAAVLDLKTKREEEFLDQARQFAVNCHLGTLAGSHQVMTDIMGEGMSQITETVKKIDDEVGRQLLSPGVAGSLDVAGLRATINQNFDTVRKAEGKRFAAARKERVRQWTEDIQNQLFEATLTSVADKGMLHTIEYLKHLSVDLTATANVLDSNTQKLKEEIRNLRDLAGNALSAVGNRVKLALGSPEVQQNLQLQSRDTAAQLQSGTNSLVSEILRDLIVGSIAPLTSELERVQSNFSSSIINSVATREHLQSLARDNKTPAHLIPPRNVIFLDSPDNFHVDFDRLLSETFGEVQSEVNLRSAAREVLADFWQGRPSNGGEFPTKQQLITAKAWWRTGIEALRDESTQPSKASYEVQNMDVNALEVTARNWQRTRMGVSKYTVVSSMKDYIYPKDASNRTSEFLLAFERAVAMSGVMVEFDHDAIERYSGGRSKPTIARFVNGIPLELTKTGTDKTDEAKAAIDIMMRSDFDETTAEGYFQRTPQPSVLVFSVIKDKMPPTLLQSIGTPIYQQWAQVVADPSRRLDWYHLRRARALPSFIPVDVSVIEAMIKGWTIARGLGLIPNEDVEEFKSQDGNYAIRLFDPEESSAVNGYIKFPQTVLLGARTHEEMASGEVLPALLESMLLGYVAISSGWLDAYARVAEIGFGLKDLKEWISSGMVLNQQNSSVGISSIDSLAGLGTPVERVAAFTKYLDDRIADHQSVLNTKYSFDEIGDASREWELRQHIQTALIDMKEKITDFIDETSRVPK